VHGALWKVDRWILRPLRCAHVLKKGEFLLGQRSAPKEATFLQIEGVHSKECLVLEGCKLEQGRGIRIKECALHSLRVQGTILKNKGSPIKASDCAHALLASMRPFCN